MPDLCTEAQSGIDVSVLIVNYNGLRFLPPLLDGLARAFQRFRHETIVVDNASTDGSAAFLAQRTDVQAVLESRNTGFTEGNNIAARHARGRVLLLLNNDTAVIEPLDALVEAALQSEVGAVGCRLEYSDGRLQHSMGLAHTPVRLVASWLGLEKRAGVARVFRKFETNAALYAQAQPQVDWVSGACLATRADVWRRLGGLDEAFFMYCEDVDYAMRVRAQGLRVAYLPRPTVVHYEGAGKAWIGEAALLRTVRSYFILLSKHHGPFAARAVAAGLAPLFAARAFVFGWRSRRSQGPQARLNHDKALAYARAVAAVRVGARGSRNPDAVRPAGAQSPTPH